MKSRRLCQTTLNVLTQFLFTSNLRLVNEFTLCATLRELFSDTLIPLSLTSCDRFYIFEVGHERTGLELSYIVCAFVVKVARI